MFNVPPAPKVIWRKRPWIRASSDISDSSALFPIEMISIFFPLLSVQHKHITVCQFSIEANIDTCMCS